MFTNGIVAITSGLGREYINYLCFLGLSDRRGSVKQKLCIQYGFPVWEMIPQLYKILWHTSIPLFEALLHVICSNYIFFFWWSQLKFDVVDICYKPPILLQTMSLWKHNPSVRIARLVSPQHQMAWCLWVTFDLILKTDT